MLLKKRNILKILLRSCRNYTSERLLTVLGIESSCDDTGIAIVNSKGQVLANVLESQQNVHTKYGGIIPPRAQDMHRARIDDVFQRCMAMAQINAEELDAIAVTNRPGLPLSLSVGLRYAKHLARKYNKPLLPIHHMEAHALQARMENEISYPFLCLLISGGHCQLAFVHSPNKFELLGESIDDAPGEVFDKIARRLRLFILPQYRQWSGGRAIEHAAYTANNPAVYLNDFPLPLARQRNCMFSFTGFKNSSNNILKQQEKLQKIPADGIISNYNDFCASLLSACCRHIMHRTQRAIEFCVAQGIFGNKPRALIVSGGVANNDYIFEQITQLATHFDCITYRPSKKYCSDNGVMIAWNGIEHMLNADRSNCLRWDYDSISVQGKSVLGESLLAEVEAANLKCKWVKLKTINPKT